MDRQTIITTIEGIRNLALKAKSGISDNGYRIGRVTPATTYGQTEKDHALHFQGLAYEQVSEIAKGLNLVLDELGDLSSE
jgi:hypothetical protein